MMIVMMMMMMMMMMMIVVSSRLMQAQTQITRTQSVIIRSALCCKADCFITDWTNEAVDLWLQTFVTEAQAH
jgi:hypothetical protein